MFHAVNKYFSRQNYKINLVEVTDKLGRVILNENYF